MSDRPITPNSLLLPAQAQAAEEAFPSSLLTPARLRIWGKRSVLSLLDQGLTAGSGFLLNVLLARWLSREAYGTFTVSFAAFLLLSGFHNVFFVEPMTVIGPSSYPGRLTEYFGEQLRTHILLLGTLCGLGLLAGGLLAIVTSGGPLSAVIMAAASTIPLLLTFWLARRMCYVVQDPALAAQASALYFVLLFAGAFGLRKLSFLNPATAFLLMACFGGFASCLILWRLRVPLQFCTGWKSPSLRQVLKENWTYGRWLILTTALSWISLQAQTFLAAAFLGLASAGALRAMQLPSLAMTQVTGAASLLLLPSMSQELCRGNVNRLRQKAILATVFITALGFLFVTGLFLFANPLERILFREKYSTSAWLIPVLGIVPVFMGFSSSLSLALRALGKSQFELFAYFFSAIAALVSAYVLMPKWGLAGAAASIVGSAGVLTISVLVCFWKWGNSRDYQYGNSE